MCHGPRGSPVFAAQMREGWKEAAVGIIEVAEFDAATMSRLLKYQYDGHYSTERSSHDEEPKTTCSDANRQLLLHISVTAAADYYQIKGLKDWAVFKFKAAIENSCWKSGGFIQVIQSVYAVLAPQDWSLREAVVKVVMANWSPDMKVDGFEKLMSNCGQLAIDIMRAQGKKDAAMVTAARHLYHRERLENNFHRDSLSASRASWATTQGSLEAQVKELERKHENQVEHHKAALNLKDAEHKQILETKEQQYIEEVERAAKDQAVSAAVVKKKDEDGKEKQKQIDGLEEDVLKLLGKHTRLVQAVKAQQTMDDKKEEMAGILKGLCHVETPCCGATLDDQIPSMWSRVQSFLGLLYCIKCFKTFGPKPAVRSKTIVLRLKKPAEEEKST